VPIGGDVAFLRVKEPRAVAGIGEGAGVELAEDRIAITCNEVVDGVAEGTRDHTAHRCCDSPNAAEGCKDKDGGVGASQETFGGLLWVDDQVDGLERCSGRAMALENLCGERALEGGEAEDRGVIATEDELDETVAESANTVVEEDRVGGIGHRCGLNRSARRGSVPIAGALKMAEHGKKAM